MGQRIWLIFQKCLVVTKLCLSYITPALAAFSTFHVEISPLLCKVNVCLVIETQSLLLEKFIGQNVEK